MSSRKENCKDCSGEGSYIREIYGVSEKRAEFILNSTYPSNFKGPVDFANHAFSILNGDTEIKYLFAHMAAVMYDVTFKAKMLDFLLFNGIIDEQMLDDFASGIPIQFARENDKNNDPSQHYIG